LFKPHAHFIVSKFNSGAAAASIRAGISHAHAHLATGEILNKKMNREFEWMNLNNWNFKGKALDNTENSLEPRLQSQRAVIAREQSRDALVSSNGALGDGSCGVQ